MSEKESFSALLGENNFCATAVAQERIVIVMKVRNLILKSSPPFPLSEREGGKM